MRRLLVLRFSAVGDVLMTVPVIDALARHCPDVQVTVCSRPWARSIFALLPPNVRFIGADLKGEYRGWRGLNALYRRLLALQPEAVADLHDVLRTQWLRLRFGAAGVRVACIDKDRRARKRFLRDRVKELQPPVTGRYADVFRRLGFQDLEVDFRSLFGADGADLARQAPAFDPARRPERHWVAVAPFAAFEGKTYPLPQMEQVVAALAARGDVRVLLFGAGDAERAVTERWAAAYEHVESLVGRLGSMAEEAAVISHCRAMVSMDSANMHLASLVAVPVVSIWGATHPYGGFMGYAQSQTDALHRPDLDCRPCSTFGKRPCRFGDYRCLTGLSPQAVVAKVEEKLEIK